ncbi:argininosuccinate synthase-related protein [Vibrio sp. WXL103]|uniref:argininosuccinate synthase-related protein n=1 Tax=Vibrio sp. WXL103 TaxID=3450710 RepID=UPI003EC8D722
MKKIIHNLDQLRQVAGQCQHLLTLFSGGLDSSYLLEVLKDAPCKVTAVAIDLGDALDKQQLTLITKHYNVDLVMLDARSDFVEHALLGAIWHQAKYLNDYPVSSSLSRPVIVKQAVQLASKLGCDAIIHTATQSQNSLRRLNGAIERSGFSGYYGSPYEGSPVSRQEKAKALFNAGLVGFKSRTVSCDSNLWCREFESGVLDDPENCRVPESLYAWSCYRPEYHLDNHQVTVSFYKGYPTAINGKPQPLLSMIEFLNRHVGSYQIGRYVGFDHLAGDEKVLEIREAPAATVLMQAYKLLETACLPTDVLRAKLSQNDIWTQEAVEGRFGSPLQMASQAFVACTAQSVTGSITFELSRGQCLPSAIVASHPRYLRDRDLWERNAVHRDSQPSLAPSSTQHVA